MINLAKYRSTEVTLQESRPKQDIPVVWSRAMETNCWCKMQSGHCESCTDTESFDQPKDLTHVVWHCFDITTISILHWDHDKYMQWKAENCLYLCGFFLRGRRVWPMAVDHEIPGSRRGNLTSKSRLLEATRDFECLLTGRKLQISFLNIPYITYTDWSHSLKWPIGFPLWHHQQHPFAISRFRTPAQGEDILQADGLWVLWQLRSNVGTASLVVWQWAGGSQIQSNSNTTTIAQVDPLCLKNKTHDCSTQNAVCICLHQNWQEPNSIAMGTTCH